METWQKNLFVGLFGSFSTVVAMTLLLPFLPLYVEQLGVSGHASITQWSGLLYGITFVSAGLVAPLWGHLGDRYGRKSMLIRASFGMAICMTLMGMVTNIWELTGLRLLIGFAGGYSSGATILVADQTPSAKSGQALGLISIGQMAGNLIGPLVGGALPPIIGIRATFFCAAGLIFVAFITTTFFIREIPPEKRVAPDTEHDDQTIFRPKGIIMAMLATGFMLMVANMTIAPIINLCVHDLSHHTQDVTLASGIIMSAAALGSVISATHLGKLADHVGHQKVIIYALLFSGVLLMLQATVQATWQLIVLCFLMGLALGGLLPSVTSVIKHNVSSHGIGKILGLSVAAQFVGQFSGPMLGGFVGGHLGMRAVFFVTGVLVLLNLIYVIWQARKPISNPSY